MDDSQPEVLLERRDGVVIITLNRPHRRNAVSAALCARLHDHLVEVSSSTAQVVVLKGAGSDFCVGADLDADPNGGATATASRSKAYDIPALLHRMPQVTIAAIDGGCAGAGLGWACACDFRFASSRARFSTAFLMVGASGDMALAWSLTKLVGGARARELMFFPEKFGGQDALALGIVSRLFDAEQLFDEAMVAAVALASAPAQTLRAMKANMISAEELSLEAYVDIETTRHLELAASLRESFAAFRAAKKHKPPA